jgi:hypothetical protein
VLGKGKRENMKDTVKRVRRITEYAETALRTETINLKLLPTDAAALWDARNKRSVVVIDALDTGAHISTMQTLQDPGLKSIIQPPQAESDPTVQMVADWQMRIEHWRSHRDSALKAINKMVSGT